MEYWFTADPHLGHSNILRLCRREEFLSEEELRLLYDPEAGKWRPSQESTDRHDAAIIANINAVVQPGDELWILATSAGAERGRPSDTWSRLPVRT